MTLFCGLFITYLSCVPAIAIVIVTVVQYYFNLSIQFNDILKVIIAKVNVVDACR